MPPSYRMGPVPNPPRELVIHFVSNGKTLCGIPTPDLKYFERWVCPRDWDAGACNCEKCKERTKR